MEEYSFRQKAFHQAVESLGVGVPLLDVSASHKNSQCVEYWGEGDDAFSKSWAGKGLLWVNPPFSRLDEVVNKITTEAAKCLLVCPDWPGTKWFKVAQKNMTKAPFFQTGSRIFQTADGNVGPTRWGVWVFYFEGTPKDTAVRMVTGPSKGEQQLKVRVRLLSDECEVVSPAEALIDTGAEVCIVRKGTVPPEFFRPAQRPLRLIGANAKRLEGGDKEASLCGLHIGCA